MAKRITKKIPKQPIRVFNPTQDMERMGRAKRVYRYYMPLNNIRQKSLEQLAREAFNIDHNSRNYYNNRRLRNFIVGEDNIDSIIDLNSALKEGCIFTKEYVDRINSLKIPITHIYTEVDIEVSFDLYWGSAYQDSFNYLKHFLATDWEITVKQIKD